MEKTKVVIASILKPIDDTRMYEKFGLSLGQTSKYEINIIGFASKNIPHNTDIEFHPISTFPRSSIKRLFSPWQVWKNYIKVKPKVIIFNTHELLIVTFLYKILFGAKIIYDIRENYAQNIRLQGIYHWTIKPFLSTWVRLKEWLVTPFINRQIVAERSYLNELGFLKKSTIVLENKYQTLEDEVIESSRSHNPSEIRLLYSGTIATSYGIFEAIELAKKLHQQNQNIRLTIIGYCAKRADLIKLKAEIINCEFVELKGGDHLVPHNEIVQEIKTADFGLIFNRPNPVSDNKLPTRLFEYTANQLPILIINNPYWLEFLNQFNAGISVIPDETDSRALLESMSSSIFYDRGDISSSLWKSEESKLIELVNQLF